jgi:intein/homing endonuclease
MKSIIKIEGADAIIEGMYSLETVVDTTSYVVAGHEFVAAFQNGFWDGRKKLFNKRRKSFPSGLVPFVVAALKEDGFEVKVVDNRECPGNIFIGSHDLELNGIKFDYPYDFQPEAAMALCKAGRGILDAATNCISGETTIEVHRAGKSFKTSLENLYKKFNGLRTKPNYKWDLSIDTKIRSRTNEGYIKLNKILNVYDSKVKKTFILKTESGKEVRTSLDHRFLTSEGWKKLKSIKVGDFIHVDGGKTSEGEKIRRYKAIYGMDNHPYRAKHTDKRSGRKTYYSVQEHRIVLEAKINGLNKDEFIYRIKNNNLENLKFIDPKKNHVHHIDGNVKNNSPENLELTDRITHWRDHGKITWRNVIAKTVLNKVVSIEKHKKEMTYDIEVENDHNFLANGIVVHNSGKTSIAALVIKMIKQPTLYIVPSLELLYQTKEVFEKRLCTEIGIVGDGNWNPNIITIATIGTLYSRMATEEGKQLLNTKNLMISDECHHSSSDSYYEVMRACNAYYRFGMSGTPLKRTDGSDLKLIAATGPVVYSIKNKELITRGISAQPYLKFIEIDKPRLARSLKYRDVYVKGIVENEYRNNLLAEIALQYAKEGHTVLILIREIAHGKIFDKILPSTVSHRFISGKETSEFRRQTLKDFKEGKISILISSTILDEGVDVPNIDVGILAGGGKSSIKLLQRIGRTLRTGGSHDWVIIIDTIDLQHRYLAKHSYGRLQIYKEEDCFEMEVK